MTRSASGGVRATGAVHGELTQVCVVSLEPFPATVDEEIDVRFAPRSDDEAARGAPKEPETFSMADEDEPDPIVDGKIDLGALAAEFFALGLDPYPRKPGASFESPEEARGDGLAVFGARLPRAEEPRLNVQDAVAVKAPPRPHRLRRLARRSGMVCEEASPVVANGVALRAEDAIVRRAGRGPGMAWGAVGRGNGERHPHSA